MSPTDQAMAQDGAYPSRPVMPLLVEAQRKAAHAEGCAFYSTYEWMGGKGSAAKWFKRGLVGSDFTHLTQKGANKLADALFDALMTGYQRYALALTRRSRVLAALAGCGSGCDGERAREDRPRRGRPTSRSQEPVSRRPRSMPGCR